MKPLDGELIVAYAPDWLTIGILEQPTHSPGTEDGMAFHMAFVVLPFGKRKWTNADGKTECVELVRQTAGAPPTRLWRPGLKVRDAKPGEIPPYTGIATFVDGRYPTDDKGRHAALYLFHTAKEIRVIDQWNSQGEARPRSIRFDNKHAKSRSDEGNFFSVIEPLTGSLGTS